MNSELIEVFTFFLKLGTLGFGGPLALVSSMHKHCVEKKHWLNHQEFNSTFSLIKALPGPIAFMMAVYLGRKRAGFWGGLVAAITLNLPAFCLMILFSLFFSSVAQLSFVHALMLGMQTSALGVILGSLKGLIKGNEKKLFFWFLVIISGSINFHHPSIEPIVIIIFGLMMIVIKNRERFYRHSMFDLGTLALVCLKAGALVFGSGLAIVPMLQHDVVTNYHWLTQSEFLDALAFGQMTPGPVVITATYIGHKMYGIPGAIVATVAMFSAAFFHMSTWFPHVVKKLQGKKWIDDFLYGAVAAVVGPIISAVIHLGLGIGFTPFLFALFLASFVLAILGKLPLWLIIPLSGLLSLAVSFIY